MSQEDWEKLEAEEGREEVAHVVRDVIKTAGISALVAATGGLAAGVFAALGLGGKAIHDVQKRSDERDGD